MDRFVLWLYRMQQHLQLTRGEGWALITVLGVFTVGLISYAVQRDAAPPPLADPPQVRPVPHLNPSPAANQPGRAALGAAASSDATEPSPSAPAAPVDLNTASIPELERLPGIGPVLAERIILYRTDHGPFQQIDDLQRVRGIGTKTLAAVRPLVAVRRAPSSE